MDVLDIVVNEIDERLKPVEAAILAGRADTFDEYKRLCGEVRGILTAREIITAVRDKMETFDDE